MNQGLPIPTVGWTYCPRCDANNMLATEPGKRFDCPMCGLVLTATSMQGEIVALVAIPSLELEEMVRYQAYLARAFSKRYEEQQAKLLNQEMPWRVRLCLKVINAIAWWFGCECRVIRDKAIYKKEKEVNSGQTKRPRKGKN